jgi:hypothetical protein
MLIPTNLVTKLIGKGKEKIKDRMKIKFMKK